jgi:ribokinase
VTPDAAVRVAVLGHVEWVTHARGRIPPPGVIGYLSEPFDEPGGGGAISASQVAKLGADCPFFTALGTDDAGDRTMSILGGIGVSVLAARRPGPQTRGLSVTEGGDADRTIIVIGESVSPTIRDPLPWEDLGGCDAVYFTGWDPETLRAARAARTLVVTGRRLGVLAQSGVRADVVVASGADPAEAVRPGALPVPPRVIVRTEGGRGGTYIVDDGPERRFPAAPPPGPAVDTYGCGDSFVAGLTVGLGRGLDLEDALALAARCGAANLTGRGGLRAQLRTDGASGVVSGR